MCRHVGDDFVVPNRKKIGGELLDINYENTYNLNKAELIREARVFGFAWMGDGATIHKMPLMNILALNGTTPPMTVSIHDCTKHMEAGGKKDATFIAELFEVKVLEYDPQLLCTDVFYFDGASNVQKAGEILMAKFPRSFCFRHFLLAFKMFCWLMRYLFVGDCCNLGSFGRFKALFRCFFFEFSLLFRLFSNFPGLAFRELQVLSPKTLSIATTAVTFPVLEFSIAISLALIVSSASLVALIGRVSVDFK